jgi:sporulation-control protein spo0M
MSARPDTTEHIVIEFDRPRSISRILYEVETMQQRTQEVRVEVSEDGGQSYRQILVQEYNFSPRGATYQREEQRFNLPQVTHLRLTIVPNKSGSGTVTLTRLRLFA